VPLESAHMFPTVEVRWFQAGVPPPELVAWFQQGERHPEEQPHRVDYYLRLRQGDSLGIKFREGRIEIKQRQRSYGIIHFHERVSGLVESWHKWSFELTEASGDLTTLFAPASPWIGVQKARHVRKYGVTAVGRILAVPADEQPERGCSLELTDVAVGGMPWWTVGFEAFGDEGGLREVLLCVVEHVLAQGQAPVLDAKDSYGYPAWLRAMVPTEGNASRS
jgi:hypothetical protein